MDAVERVARELCIASGEDPDRRLQDLGRTSWSYPAWENFRADARRRLDAHIGRGDATKRPHACFDERRPDQWQRICAPAWRSLKKSIVAAGAAGAISASTAERLINRFNLKDL